ncbi:MAG: UDP-N-acetylmuramate--L-alanine ligase [Thermodesulfovibrionia bacterium]
MYKKFEIVHFVGIGGAGMSGIAEVLKNLGHEVSGSDLKESETTKRLETLGISIYIGHRAENIKGAHVVVVSSAVSSANPEVMAARKHSIPVIPRVEMLAELARLKYSVLVAGSHGKTTTTSLIASLLASGGLDPTVVIGGKWKGIRGNAKLGQGEFLVAEADESDGSFLKLSPTIAVITNINREHLDFFKNIDELKSAFLSFVNRVPFYGLSILCADNEHVKELLPKIQRRFITYGLGEDADLVGKNIKIEGLKTKFEAVSGGESVGVFEVPLPGVHNIYNSLAAIGTALELKLDMNSVRKALYEFSGIQRRFEFKGEMSGIRIFDDYGHHPAEIMATLKAAREAIAHLTVKGEVKGGCEGRVVVLFQPHRYTRTRDLLSDFFKAFTDADKVILMDIYPAGEEPLNGINSEVLFKGIKDTGKDVVYMRNRVDIPGYLSGTLKKGDMLLTLGAGDVWKTGNEFIKIKVQNGR